MAVSLCRPGRVGLPGAVPWVTAEGGAGGVSTKVAAGDGET